MEKERLTLFAVTLITKRLMPISTGCAWTTKVSFKANQCQEPLDGKEVGKSSVISYNVFCCYFDTYVFSASFKRWRVDYKSWASLCLLALAP